MSASEEAMYITPTSETIKNLDALRKDGESFSDIVGRLAADGVEDACLGKFTPDLRQKLDSVREADEEYTDVIHRLLEPFSPKMWQELDDLRDGVESHVAIINRLIKSYQETEGAKLAPELRTIVDKVRHDGETHTSAIIRIVKAFQKMEDVRVGKLTPDLWQKLDAIRFEEEEYVGVIHRLIKEHNAHGDPYTVYITKSMSDALVAARTAGETTLSTMERMIAHYQETMNVGMSHVVLNAALWQKLDSVRGDGETYDEELNRLLDEHALVSRHNVVYLTKSMQDNLITIRKSLRDDLGVITDADETHVGLLCRLIEEKLAAKNASVDEFPLPIRMKLDAFRSNGESYTSVIDHLIQTRNAVAVSQEERQLVHLTKSMRNDLDVIIDGTETQIGVIARLIKEHLTIKQQQSMTPLGSSAVMRVKMSTRIRIERMAQPDEDYNEAMVRLLDERYLYQKIAKGMGEEGQRLLHNQSAIIGNFKLIIGELVKIDDVNVRDEDNIVHRDVNELLAEMLAAQSDEEGDST